MQQTLGNKESTMCRNLLTAYVATVQKLAKGLQSEKVIFPFSLFNQARKADTALRV